MKTAWYAGIPGPTALEQQEYELGGGYIELPSDATREQAFEVVLKAHYFATGGVGFAGTEPPQLRGFRRLLAEPDAADAFDDLTRRSDLAGQMYGLWGLYVTDRARFDTSTMKYNNDARPVQMMIGCIGISVTTENLVREIAGGAYPFTTARRRPSTSGSD